MKYILFIMVVMFSGPALADRTITLDFDHISRSAWLALPDKYDNFRTYPTVIVLHGGGGSSEQVRKMTKFDQLGDKEGFITVFPNGTPGLGNTMMSWNAGDCCGKAQRENIDDVRFLDVLVDTLIKHYSADPKRIYMVGHSNGAMMTYRYACRHPEKLAAIAANAGQEWYKDCVKARRPVPILHIHGTKDQCANYNGGQECGGCFQQFLGLPADNATRACLPVPRNMELWAEFYGCPARPRESFSKGAVSCEAWTGCRAQSSVTFCKVKDAAHSWPGAINPVAVCRNAPQSDRCQSWKRYMGKENRDINATGFIWNFFSQHKLNP